MRTGGSCNGCSMRMECLEVQPMTANNGVPAKSKVVNDGLCAGTFVIRRGTECCTDVVDDGGVRGAFVVSRFSVR